MDSPAPAIAALAGRNLVLTGFMGTGKTTVGRIVALRLGYDLVDTDALIVERHGPIPELFAERGEEGFRILELDTAAELAQRMRTVIATGGRMLLDPANEKALGATGLILCLRATVDTLLDRLLAGGAVADRQVLADRPMLAGDDPAGRIADLLAERAEGYGRFPGVDTDGLDPEAVADAVLGAVVAAVLATGEPVEYT